MLNGIFLCGVAKATLHHTLVHLVPTPQKRVVKVFAVKVGSVESPPFSWKYWNFPAWIWQLVVHLLYGRVGLTRSIFGCIVFLGVAHNVPPTVPLKPFL